MTNMSKPSANRGSKVRIKRMPAKPKRDPKKIMPLHTVPAKALVYDRQRSLSVHRKRLERLVASILEAAGCNGRVLHVTLIDDAEMVAINLSTFGKNRTTNVISYPAADMPGEDARFLGDVVVSTATASREATAAGMPAADRMVQLIVHGLLHITGYDHVGVSPAERRRMRLAENALYQQVASDTAGTLI